LFSYKECSSNSSNFIIKVTPTQLFRTSDKLAKAKINHLIFPVYWLRIPFLFLIANILLSLQEVRIYSYNLLSWFTFQYPKYPMDCITIFELRSFKFASLFCWIVLSLGYGVQLLLQTVFIHLKNFAFYINISSEEVAQWQY